MPDSMKASKFLEELTELLNKHNKGNDSNTPDFILARHLCICLSSLNLTIKIRSELKENNQFNTLPENLELLMDGKERLGKMKRYEGYTIFKGFISSRKFKLQCCDYLLDEKNLRDVIESYKEI